MGTSNLPCFVADTPVDLSEGDKLRHLAFAQSVARAAKDAANGSVIGLLGSWGAGKTSIMDWVADELSGSGWVVARLNCWKYTANCLRRQWIVEARVALEPHRKRICILQGLRQARTETKVTGHTVQVPLRRVFRVLLVAILAICGVAVILSLLGYDRALGGVQATLTASVLLYLFGAFRQEIRVEPVTEALSNPPPMDADEFEIEWHKVLADAKGRRFLFLIDDLDRCAAETALEVFETIKTFTDSSDCVYLMACDEAALRRQLRKQGYNADEYLQKIINARFYIPAPYAGDLYDLLGELLKEAHLSVDERTREAICYGLQDSPRHAKQFVNNLVADVRSLAQRAVKGEGRCRSLVDERQSEVAKLTVLRTLFPDCYDKITRDPGLIGELDTWARQRQSDGSTEAYNSKELCGGCPARPDGCRDSTSTERLTRLCRFLSQTEPTPLETAYLLVGLKEPYPDGCPEVAKAALHCLFFGDGTELPSIMARADETSARIVCSHVAGKLAELRATKRLDRALDVCRTVAEQWGAVPEDGRLVLAEAVGEVVLAKGQQPIVGLLPALAHAGPPLRSRVVSLVLGDGTGSMPDGAWDVIAALGALDDSGTSPHLSARVVQDLGLAEAKRQGVVAALDAMITRAQNGTLEADWVKVAEQTAVLLRSGGEWSPNAVDAMMRLLSRLYAKAVATPSDEFFSAFGGIAQGKVRDVGSEGDHVRAFLHDCLDPLVETGLVSPSGAVILTKAFAGAVASDTRADLGLVCCAWNAWLSDAAGPIQVAEQPEFGALLELIGRQRSDGAWVQELLNQFQDRVPGNPVVAAFIERLWGTPVDHPAAELLFPSLRLIGDQQAEALVQHILQALASPDGWERGAVRLASALQEADDELRRCGDLSGEMLAYWERARTANWDNRPRDSRDSEAVRTLLTCLAQHAKGEGLSTVADKVVLVGLDAPANLRSLAVATAIGIARALGDANRPLCDGIADWAVGQLRRAEVRDDAILQMDCAQVLKAYKPWVSKGTVPANAILVKHVTDAAARSVLEAL